METTLFLSQEQSRILLIKDVVESPNHPSLEKDMTLFISYSDKYLKLQMSS